MAGKTTTINMLVGFLTPTRGWATIFGYNIRTHMRKIYTLMGVCPQHDILWEPMTARQHLLFYGRLKNIPEDRLDAAVRAALRDVRCMHLFLHVFFFMRLSVDVCCGCCMHV
jgi:ABC-type multidrug transport system ATPase subunit